MDCENARNKRLCSQARMVLRYCSSFVLYFIMLGSAFGAPYPLEGLQMEWVQPDGTRLNLRVFGDEFYARTATDNGYTVIFVPEDKAYYYAIVGPDGESLIPSKIEAGKRPPKTIPKHLEESSKIVGAKRAMNIEKFSPGRSADWAARKKAAQAARARDAKSKAAASDTPQKPGCTGKSSEPMLEKK